jgi:hypothetical protein
MQIVDVLRSLRRIGETNAPKFDIARLATVYKAFGPHYRKYWKTLVVALLSLLAAVAVSALTRA